MCFELKRKDVSHSLESVSLSLNLFVGAVEKLCICVTFDKKLGD